MFPCQFDRPYGKYPMIFEAPLSIGSGEFLLWEFPLCYWLEQHGYDVTYCSNSDMLSPGAAARARRSSASATTNTGTCASSKPRDRWSRDGMNILFFSGNTACWCRLLRRQATAGRTASSRAPARSAALSEAERKTYARVLGPFDSAGPDEGQLIGARTVVPFNGVRRLDLHQSRPLDLRGHGHERGDRIPGLVGWEYHGEPADIPGLEVVGEGTVLSNVQYAPAAARPLGNLSGHWTATIYPGPKGNFVFNASTIFWAQGLASARPHASLVARVPPARPR